MCFVLVFVEFYNAFSSDLFIYTQKIVVFFFLTIILYLEESLCQIATCFVFNSQSEHKWTEVHLKSPYNENKRL